MRRMFNRDVRESEYRSAVLTLLVIIALENAALIVLVLVR